MYRLPEASTARLWVNQVAPEWQARNRRCCPGVPLPATVVMMPVSARNIAHHLVLRIGDINVSGRVNGHALRRIQLGAEGGAAVAGIACRPFPGYPGHHAAGQNEDRVQGGKVHISRRVHRDPARQIRPRHWLPRRWPARECLRQRSRSHSFAPAACPAHTLPIPRKALILPIPVPAPHTAGHPKKPDPLPFVFLVGIATTRRGPSVSKPFDVAKCTRVPL